MCTTVCLGEGFTPWHYSPQSQPGEPKIQQKSWELKSNICGWQWNRSVSYLCAPIHQFPHKFIYCSIYFLILALRIQILTAISICHCINYLPAISSNVPQDPHPCSSVNSSLICSLCFSLISYIVLRAWVSFHPWLFHINPLKMVFIVHFPSNFTQTMIDAEGETYMCSLGISDTMNRHGIHGSHTLPYFCA